MNKRPRGNEHGKDHHPWRRQAVPRPGAVGASETPDHRRALDWMLDAFRVLPQPAFNFVGGYQLDDIVRHFPEIDYTVNSD
jgi:hypothetical protein